MAKAQKAKQDYLKYHLPYLMIVGIVAIVALVILVVAYSQFKGALVGEAYTLRKLPPPPSTIKAPSNLPDTVARTSPSAEIIPTEDIFCPYEFTPSNINHPDGFSMSTVYLAGILCETTGMRCVYNSEKLPSLSDYFTEATLDSMKAKAAAGSLSITAEPPQGKVLANCVHTEFIGCKCQVIDEN